jgi:hypothetical protein
MFKSEVKRCVVLQGSMICNEFENEVDLYTINSNDLEGVKLSPKALLAIEFIINDEEEEEK